LSVLVTGPDTLLGFHVLREAVESGLSPRTFARQGDELRIEALGATVAAGSTADLESCLLALEGATAVFHCESGRLSSSSAQDQGGAFLEGTRNLLVAMARVGVEDLIYCGSAFTFKPGTVAEPGDETTRWDNPSGLLAVKVLAAAGDLVQRYNEDGKVRCVTVSPTLPAGPGGPPDGAFRAAIEAVRAGARWAGGGMNVVRAQDAAAAAVRALGRGKAGESFILAGENVQAARLVSGIEGALQAGGAVAREEVPAHRRGLFTKRGDRGRGAGEEIELLLQAGMYYSPARAVDRLGLAVTPFEETVREAVASYLSENA